MLIKVLDRGAMGADTPFDALYRLGDVEIYDSTSESELCDRLSDADVIILNKIKITEKAIRCAAQLKLICVFATGYDNIDLNAARSANIAVCNVPGYSTDSVALFTTSIALSLYTHMREYNSYVVSGEYSRSGVANRLVPVFHELRGKTWGIVGCGNIGCAVARVAQALGARVIVNKRTPVPEFECVTLEELCRESDIITLHCPLNDQTKGMINKKVIDLMKKDVIIVNAARGAVVNEQDIVDALLSGRIGGFGADVYSSEPFSVDHPFYNIKGLDNVLFTPHAAWGSYESRKRCIDVICENIRAYTSGEIKNRVDI